MAEATKADADVTMLESAQEKLGELQSRLDLSIANPRNCQAIWTGLKAAETVYQTGELPEPPLRYITDVCKPFFPAEPRAPPASACAGEGAARGWAHGGCGATKRAPARRGPADSGRKAVT